MLTKDYDKQNAYTFDKCRSMYILLIVCGSGRTFSYRGNSVCLFVQVSTVGTFCFLNYYSVNVHIILLGTGS